MWNFLAKKEIRKFKERYANMLVQTANDIAREGVANSTKGNVNRPDLKEKEHDIIKVSR